MRTTKEEVAQAKREWINTMKREYPEFNAKLWTKNSSYRAQHPQKSAVI